MALVPVDVAGSDPDEIGQQPVLSPSKESNLHQCIHANAFFFKNVAKYQS